MLLTEWLRDKKNLTLLDWIKPLVFAGWTLLVYVLTPSVPVAPSLSNSAPAHPLSSGPSQHAEIGTVQDKAEVDIQQKIINTQSTEAEQSTKAGAIKDSAKVTIKQEQ